MTSGNAINVAPLVPVPVRVLDLQPETHDIFTMHLEPPHRAEPFAFRPGQFNMLYAFGVGEAAVSISGTAGGGSAITHTIRSVGSVTRALSKVRAGGMVGLRGPFGSGWPLEAIRGSDVVIITGGIGLAPLRPVILHLLAHRSDFGRVHLLHGVRTPADMFYARDLADWSLVPDVRVLVAANNADASWRGRVGVVTSLIDSIDLEPARTIALMCGPEIMMRFALRELRHHGLTDDRCYVSTERNMQCAVGFCGHCQFGPSFVCMDGPVFRYDRIRNVFETREA